MITYNWQADTMFFCVLFFLHLFSLFLGAYVRHLYFTSLSIIQCFKHKIVHIKMWSDISRSVIDSTIRIWSDLSMSVIGSTIRMWSDLSRSAIGSTIRIVVWSLLVCDWLNLTINHRSNFQLNSAQCVRHSMWEIWGMEVSWHAKYKILLLWKDVVIFTGPMTG